MTDRPKSSISSRLDDVGGGSSLHLADRDRLCSLPQTTPSHLTETPIPALIGDDGREVVRGELADLGRGRAAAVRKEDLALADAARVDREMARRGMGRVVLIVEAGSEVAERDPCRLASPATVDELRLDGQHAPDGVDGARRGGLPSSGKVEVSDDDLQRTHARRIAWRRMPNTRLPPSTPTSSIPAA